MSMRSKRYSISIVILFCIFVLFLICLYNLFKWSNQTEISMSISSHSSPVLFPDADNPHVQNFQSIHSQNQNYTQSHSVWNENEYDDEDLKSVLKDAVPYLSIEDILESRKELASQRQRHHDQEHDHDRGHTGSKTSQDPVSTSKTLFSTRSCQMENCFDFSKCQSDFKVYVYPPDKFVPISVTYEKILNRIMSSIYYTNDPEEACLFVLSIDTLDRDSLSHDFVRNLGNRLSNLHYWNNGENHLIFNLYAGTWPDYNETELGFDYGKAILVKASMSLDQFRPNFDISLPLFHPHHPEKGDELGTAVSNEFPARKKHLIAFKGKRYVYGIGSETRNSIYHLHNGNDIIMVTTCKHGKNWKEMKDERCDEDNREYEKYDYETLLQNSTFCLVPRGRRLGSFRFLEALKAGCIPVLLSNGWVLPFAEVIDWPAAGIIADERSLLQTLEVIRSIDKSKIFRMKQQTQILWNQYLSSVERITETAFEIMRDRIKRHLGRTLDIWNSAPGALTVDMTFGESDVFPFYHGGNSSNLKPNFTAIIRVQQSSTTGKTLGHQSSLFRAIKNLGKSKFISKIILLWSSNKGVPRSWPDVNVPISVKQTTTNAPSQRFFTDDIETDAIFFVDEDTVLLADEYDFAYQTWRAFPDRLIGYQSRSHFWSEFKEQWMYSSKATNDYSMILNGAFIYHIYYNHLYWIRNPPAALMLVESFQNCDDIALNLLITRVTKKPPIKLASNKKFLKESNARTSTWMIQERMQQRHNCLNELYDIYGSMPLRRSNIKMDPILFRDPVSNLRKKYRQLES